MSPPNRHVQGAKKSAPPRDDWYPTRDPKDMQRIDREWDEFNRKEEAARIAHIAKLKAMEGTLLDRRQKCSGALGVMALEVRRRKNLWWNVAVDLAAVYEAAWTKFNGVFADAEKESAQNWTLAFVALSTVSMGGIAVLTKMAGDKWITNAAKDLIIAGATDSIQAGVGGLMSMAPGKLADSYELQSISSPFSYKGSLEKILNNVENDMIEWIEKKQKEILDMPLEKFEYFEPAKLDQQIADFLAKKDKEFNPQPFKEEKDKQAMIRELEKTMWMKWFASNIDPSKGAATKSRWGFYSRMPDSLIDKMVELQLIDTSSGFGSYGDDDSLKLARPPDGPNPRRIMAKARSRALVYKPARTFG